MFSLILTSCFRDASSWLFCYWLGFPMSIFQATKRCVRTLQIMANTVNHFVVNIVFQSDIKMGFVTLTVIPKTVLTMEEIVIKMYCIFKYVDIFFVHFIVVLCIKNQNNIV